MAHKALHGNPHTAKYFDDWYSNVNHAQLMLDAGYTPDAVVAKMNSRKEYFALLTKHATCFEAFDQIIEVLGAKLGRRVTWLPGIFDLGGICDTASKLWIDFMSNPKRKAVKENHKMEFSLCFDPYLACTMDRSAKLNFGVEGFWTDYSGKDLKPEATISQQMQPLFSTAVLTQSLTSVAGMGNNLFTNKEHKKAKDKFKAVKAYLEEVLPSDDTPTASGRYIHVRVSKDNSSAHVIAICRPDPHKSKQKYHMFEPNVGHFRGNKEDCAHWMIAVYDFNATHELTNWDATVFKYEGAEKDLHIITYPER